MNHQNPKIIAVLDYVIKVEGFFPYQQNQIFKVADNPKWKAMVISATTNQAFLIADKNVVHFSVGDYVYPTSQSTEISTSLKYLGTIIDVEGKILYPHNKFSLPSEIEFLAEKREIFGNIHHLMEVETIKKQLYTGIIMADLLIPIGKGQRQAIIGDRHTGKTHIALNTIINQKNDDVYCIYVAIGQRQEDVAQTYEILKKHQVLNYTFIIQASPSNPYQQYLAPYVAMAHAENLSYHKDVLIIFDDLSKHANIYREISLLTDRPVGKEAFPGDMFFMHSRLLERAGKFKNRFSITCLPIIKTVENDITSLISSNIISITDGQIVTSSDMFLDNKWPAINLDLSVSRTGKAVQNATFATVSAQIGKVYNAYKKQLKLSNLKYELSAATQSLITKGLTIEKIFIQKGFSGYSKKFLILITRLITWGSIQKIQDTEKAVKFFSILVDIDKIAKNIYQLILEGKEVSDFLMKNYFEYALWQYYNFKKIPNQLKTKLKFVDFEVEFLNRIDYKMEELN